MFIRLTELYTASNKRPVYINTEKIVALTLHRFADGSIGSRIRFDADPAKSIDIAESVEYIIAQITDTKFVIEDELNAGTRDEDGRIANNPIEPDSKADDYASMGGTWGREDNVGVHSPRPKTTG